MGIGFIGTLKLLRNDTRLGEIPTWSVITVGYVTENKQRHHVGKDSSKMLKKAPNNRILIM